MATTAASATQSYLRDARLQAGYASRDTAAIKLNYSPETIGRHERGDVPVSPDDIIRYAEGYQRPDIMLRYCASCPVGKKTGKRAALRVSQRLQKAKEIADKLESIADDGIVDHMERADFDTALAFLRSLEETITDMLLWAMSRETEKSRPAATETALVKLNYGQYSTVKAVFQGRRPP